jgi:hypothetical protein
MSFNEMVLHDDYESFASYLGVDYDDYYEMINDLNLESEEIEIEYSLSV